MARLWDDITKENLKEGRFTKDEEKTLQDTLEAYKNEFEIPEDEFYAWLTKPKNTKRNGFWPKIAEALPERSVRSVKNFCQRKFNPKNYKGRWDEKEEEQLALLHKTIGPRWSKIGDFLGRTEHNVRDKWNELEGRPKDKGGKVWSLANTLQLIELVEKQLDIKIIGPVKDVESDFVKELITLSHIKKRRKEKSIEQLAIKKTIHKHLTLTVEEIANLNIVSWKTIAKKLKPHLSINECRNRWFLLFKYDVKHNKMTKRKIMTKVIERLLELCRMDKNKHDLDYYKEQPEFDEYISIIDFLIQHRNQNVDLMSFLKQMTAYINKEPIYKLTK